MTRSRSRPKCALPYICCLSTIFARPDPATAASTWEEVRDQLAGRFPKIGPLMDRSKADVLAFKTFRGCTGRISGSGERRYLR